MAKSGFVVAANINGLGARRHFVKALTPIEALRKVRLAYRGRGVSGEYVQPRDEYEAARKFEAQQRKRERASKRGGVAA
ncbi:hypothetical protein DL1_00355 [Thioclava dalianensis]|uniref:Uncharacterized protein n=1 Tax=Thioclava dalianensis TaxID=1185766 RepID=A0A074UAQ8_9RHOB|nr:hypothetical protein [Thioclava dalianensis]KEP71757.1 hypothetical protein DL1_00355 [Thioclava dalianensis]SFN64981.1 hypothetical protein SAMN05216224_108135 [Thioclava dalianensis]